MDRREFIATVAATPVAAASAAAAEQTTGAAARVSRPLSITLLGTGTPAPSLTRQSSGYLIEVGTDLIVWDHGPGAHHRLIESGHRAIDVTHAFFTHLHYDHCMDYGRLVLQRWDQGAGRIPELQVYGPPPIARMTEQLFGENGIYAGDIAARTTSSQQPRRLRGPRRQAAASAARRRASPRFTLARWSKATAGRSRSATRNTRSRTSNVSRCGSTRPRDRSAIRATAAASPTASCELAKGCDLFIAMNHYFSGSEPTPAFRAADRQS